MNKDLMNLDPFDDSVFDNTNFFTNLGRHMLTGFHHFNNDGYANVQDTKNDYVVSVELPGFRKTNIHLDYRNKTLSVMAKHDIKNNNKNAKGKIIRQEYSTSNVSREFYLPDVIFNKITASYDGGILKIVLPKKHNQQSNSHEITIK